MTVLMVVLGMAMIYVPLVELLAIVHVIQARVLRHEARGTLAVWFLQFVVSGVVLAAVAGPFPQLSQVAVYLILGMLDLTWLVTLILTVGAYRQLTERIDAALRRAAEPRGGAQTSDGSHWS